MPWLRRHWPILTLVLLPLLPLWRAVFLGECIGPWDQIMQMAPWNGPKATSGWDVLQADGALQFYPWRDLVFDAWGKGQMPLWNPYQLCGTPLLANSQSAGFYPLHILMGVLHVPTPAAITILAWFHLAWACLGARYLAKLCGANDFGAVAAGACFGLSAFMVSWTPLASVVTTCSWIPWVLASAYQIVKAGNKRRWTAALSGSVAMMLLGGHLQFAVYGLLGLTVFGLWVAISAKSKVVVYAAAVSGVLLGNLIAAPQILPAAAFSRMSHRQVDVTAAGAAAYGQSALQLPELVGFVLPSLTGLPGYNADVDGTKLPSYWPAYLKRGAAFAEGALAVGPLIVFLLFFVNRKKVKDNAATWALAAVGLLLALGPLSIAMYLAVPGWASTGSPGRASVLVVLALCLIGGRLWPDNIEDAVVKKPWIFLNLASLLALAVGLVVATSFKPWIPGIESVLPIALPALISLMLLVPIVGYRPLAIGRKNPQALFLAIGVAGSLLSGPLFCLPTGRPLFTKNDSDPNIRFAFVNSDWGLLNAARAIMPGNTASASRIYDVAGYDSLLSKETLEMLRAVDSGKDPAPEANGNMMFVKPGFDRVKLADAGVTVVETRDGQSEYLPGRGRAFSSGGPAKILMDGYDGQIIEVTGPGTLTVKDRNMPGWTAAIDHRPVSIPTGLWRSLEIPPGVHRVEFTYRPPGLQNGLNASMFGLLATLGFLMPLRGRSKPNHDASASDSESVGSGSSKGVV